MFISEYESKDNNNDRFNFKTERSKNSTKTDISQTTNYYSSNKEKKINQPNISNNHGSSHQRQLSSQSVTKKRKQSIDILNTSNMSSSRYTERPLFSSHSNHYTQYRNQLINKNQSRIKKKIADLSKDFRNVTSHGYINRPITSVRKIEGNKFNNNFISLTKILNNNSNRNLKPSVNPKLVNYTQISLKTKMHFPTQRDNNKSDISSYAFTFKTNNNEPNTIRQIHELLSKNKIKY